MSTNDFNFEDFKNKFENEKKIIYKPRASSGGKGVKTFELTGDNFESVYEKIVALGDGIVEGYLVQHPEMQNFSISAVNTVRFVTVNPPQGNLFGKVTGENVDFLYVALRMGQGSSCVDNLHGGGMIAGVDVETGEVVTCGVDYTLKVYDVHPDTLAPILGFKIPFFNEAKQMIREASKGLPGYFGWDIAITSTGPVIIEINTNPDSVCLQLPYVPERKGMRYIVEKYL